MKKTAQFVFLICIAVGLWTSSCQKDYLLDDATEDVILKKGGKPADVEQGDLYGDLMEVERDHRGVPVLYDLEYEVEYQDEIKEGIIDVLNPRLNGNFELYILEKYVNESLKSSDIPDDGEPLPGTVPVDIEVDEDGFITNYPPAALYDGEGELLAGAAAHIFPVEEGRLNLIRSPRSVIASRLTEVLKNFGNGTVADVVRDYCGRFYMIRTQAALDESIADKPIDSPLENLGVYWELMNYGFSRSADENGLQFMIADDGEHGGFRFKARIDNDWGAGAKEFGTLSENQQEQFVANLAAACIAAASDKSNFLNFDEIAYVNQFMGVPFIPNFDSSIDQFDEVVCFFPFVQQPVRMMDKTDKTEYVKYRYYVDYSGFSYNRNKFEETILDLYTIDENNNAVILKPDLILDEILSGNVSGNIFDGFRYTAHSGILTGAVGFANQADDYVQTLELVHENEEFLRWQMPTPTWGAEQTFDRSSAQFFFDTPEESHGNKPDGKGDDETATVPTKGNKGGRR